MLTVQYRGKGERTIGGLVIYPGELLSATPKLLAAWQAEHGDVFVVVGGDVPPAPPAETAPAQPEPESVEPEQAEPESKAKHK